MKEERIIFGLCEPDPIQVGPSSNWITGSRTALRPIGPMLLWLYRHDEKGWHLAQQMPVKEVEELRDLLNQWYDKRKGKK